MTSKISFSKLLLEDLKQRSWLWAVIILILLIAQPIALMIGLGNIQEGVRLGYMKSQDIQKFYTSQMVIGNYVFTLFLMLCAVVSATSGFSYLHSKTKVDFYHSMAIKRQKMFGVQYLSGVLMIAVPYFITTLLCLVIGASNGYLNSATLSLAIQAYLFRMLCVLVMYAWMILAMVLTGKDLVASLGFLVFMIYSQLVIGTYMLLCNAFLKTYVEGFGMSTIMNYFSPIALVMTQETLLDSTGVRTILNSQESLQVWIGMAILIVQMVAVTGLSLFAHSHRMSEAAGSSMAFKKLERIIKIALVVPISILIGLIFVGMVEGSSTIWLFGGLIAGVIVFSAIIEFIYHNNMRELFIDKLQLVITGIIAVVIAFVFVSGITGYDTYLPAKEDVAAMSFFGGIDDGLLGGYNSEGLVHKERLQQKLTEDFDAIYDLAQLAVAEVKRDTEDIPTTRVTMNYKLKNGKMVYRYYDVEVGAFEEQLKVIFEGEEYRERRYPLFNMEVKEIEGIHYENERGRTELEFSQEEREEFIEIYKAELRQMTYDEYINDTVLRLSFFTQQQTSTTDDETPDYAGYAPHDYPVCASFTKTLAYMEEKQEEDIITELSTENVAEIQVESYDSMTGRQKTAVFVEPEQIEELLPHLIKSNGYIYRVSETVLYGYTVKVRLVGKEEFYEYFLDGALGVPEIVEQEFAE